MEGLYIASGAAAFLDPYHSGRRIDYFENGVGDRAITFTSGVWSFVNDPSTLPAGLHSATRNSLFGLSHDGDSTGYALGTLSGTTYTATLSYGTPFSSAGPSERFK